MDKNKKKKMNLFKVLIFYIIGSILAFLLFVIFPGKIADKNLNNVFKH